MVVSVAGARDTLPDGVRNIPRDVLILIESAVGEAIVPPRKPPVHPRDC
jgi:hypothetical protein